MDFMVEQCSFCQNVRYYYTPEDFRSNWLKRLPDKVTVAEYQPAVCDNPQCIRKGIESRRGSQHKVLASDIERSGEVIVVPRSSIRPFPNQPRKYFNQDKLKSLAKSIKKVGQLVPVFVKEVENSNGSRIRYELIDGQRRWHACDMAGITKMKVIVCSVKDEHEQFTMSVIANFGRVDHDPVETALAIQRFQEMKHTITEIAEMFARSEAWVYQYIKILSLDERVRAMMSMEVAEDDRLLFSTALLIADLPKDEQFRMAEKIVKKKLKHVQAKAIIRAKAEKIGVNVGGERTPNKDYNILLSLIRKLRREANPLLEMPQIFFDRMFQSRSSSDREKMLRNIEYGIDDLRALLGAVTKTKK